MFQLFGRVRPTSPGGQKEGHVLAGGQHMIQGDFLLHVFLGLKGVDSTSCERERNLRLADPDEGDVPETRVVELVEGHL